MMSATSEACMVLWTIYDHPSDYPNHFVVRRHGIDADFNVPLVDAKCKLADSLEEARELLPPGLHCLGREPEDDPVIVETWI
jgi:hypothetical protein